MIIIGSRAAKFWYPNFREADDWDIIAYPSEIISWVKQAKNDIAEYVSPHPKKIRFKLKSGARLEFDLIFPGTSNELLANSVGNATLDIPHGKAIVPSPIYLKLLKRSVLYWAVHWQKNIADYHWLNNQDSGFSLPEHDAFYKLRLEENTQKFGARHVNLNMSNDAFFAKSQRSVKRTLDHDSLHEVVKYYDRPLFERFKNDPEKALLSEKLFNQATFEDKVRLVKEEAMVIAFERFILPGIEKNPSVAYKRAIQYLCTNMTTGWFRDFIIESWQETSKLDIDYVGKIIEWQSKQ